MDNGKIVIEKNVPMKVALGRRPIYPWADMEVGDSFVAHKKSANMSNCARNATYKTGFKFSIRQDGDTCRVWRIA